MKIICAGPVKTGTKSLNLALKILGYSVYDFPEHFYYLHDEWVKVFDGKATIEDFKKMYDNVDVAVDTPSYHFWKELSEAYPAAKIILTVRDDEEIWAKSIIKQILQVRKNKFFCFLLNFTPIGRKWKKWQQDSDRIMFGDKPFKFWGTEVNKMLYIQHYRRQLAYVKQNAPKDRLLVFNCKEGWGPLCKFLNVPVPEGVPFPHENKHGEVADSIMHNHPLFLRLQYEAKIVSFLFVCLIAFFFYYAKDLFS